MKRLVVVGASLAGLRAAQTARKAGFEGTITLISDERHPPYDRLSLSKSFLTSNDEPKWFLSEDELAALRIDLRLEVAATGLDVTSRTVVAGKESFPYDRLVIATGANARHIPNLPDLQGILTLRTLDDAVSLRERLAHARNIVVIGAGFIGSEISSSASKRGANVTIVEAAPIPLVRAVGDIVGGALAEIHERNGVRLLREARVAAVEGYDHVTAVVLDNGERLAADAVIVGIGAAPATSWLADSGIALHPNDGGVVCDRYLETSSEGVFAAGDVAHWPNGLLDGTERLENWTNAADQGVCAGLNAVSTPDTRAPYETVPYFWSDWYGIRIQFVGTADAETVRFVEGDAGNDNFVAFYRSGDHLVGVAMVNDPRPIARFRRHIARRGSWDTAFPMLQR